MTATQWLTRALSALLALALLLGSLLAIAEVGVAAADRGPWLVPYPDWSAWMRQRSWNDWVVNAALVGLLLVGLLLMLLMIPIGSTRATMNFAAPRAWIMNCRWTPNYPRELSAPARSSKPCLRPSASR